MIEIEAKARKWGNSIGITFPNEVVKKIGIHPDEDLKLFIGKSKTSSVKDIFGILKFKRPTAKIMEEADRELDIAL